MESVIILAGLIVMSVIDIKRKSIHIGMLTAMGVIVAGIREYRVYVEQQSLTNMN